MNLQEWRQKYNKLQEGNNIERLGKMDNSNFQKLSDQ